METVNRREFLKMASMFPFLPFAPRIKAVLEPPKEQILEPRVITPDIFDFQDALPKIIQAATYKDFSPKLAWKQMGVDDPTNRHLLTQANPTTATQAKLLIATAFSLQKGNHGNKVLAAKDAFLNSLKLPIDTVSQTCNVAADFRITRAAQDANKNWVVTAELNTDTIDKALNDSQASIVSLSLQFGPSIITYARNGMVKAHPELYNNNPITSITIGDTTTYQDANGNAVSEADYKKREEMERERVLDVLPIDQRHIEFSDGYEPENAYKNLGFLADLAARHPDKFICACSGNQFRIKGEKRVPDIRVAREKLIAENRWPKNLLIVGYTIPEVTEKGTLIEVPAAYGADVYVTCKFLNELKIELASSFATPIISELLKYIVAFGYKTHETARDKLLDFFNMHFYRPFGENEISDYFLLDHEKVKRLFKQTP